MEQIENNMMHTESNITKPEPAREIVVEVPVKLTDRLVECLIWNADLHHYKTWRPAEPDDASVERAIERLLSKIGDGNLEVADPFDGDDLPRYPEGGGSDLGDIPTHE